MVEFGQFIESADPPLSLLLAVLDGVLVLGVVYVFIVGVFREFVDVVIAVNAPYLVVTAAVLFLLQLL